ncbi:hypothetical protein H5P28_07065 [Ruficoccus amylovorans]|uniref:Uncharacterized protein n=1 Tax=Ruficoccus amylovorans TaxID=1804625 RepID=A0A842HCU8_9BACT|nr:hypothetical protein [Ruficoccus amylovorans]MBC2594019.1 hypothetical protein [Ruficoccus amylovorans]
MSDEKQSSQKISKELLDKYFIEPATGQMGKEKPVEGLLLAGEVVSLNHKSFVKEQNGQTVYSVQTSVEIEANGRRYQHQDWANLTEGQTPLAEKLREKERYVFSVGGLKTFVVNDGTYTGNDGKERPNRVAELVQVRFLEVVDLEIRAKPAAGAVGGRDAGGAGARPKAAAA